jgi:hypothetical protein
MSFITPFFLSTVQKQLAPSSRNASDDEFAETHEIYHDGNEEGTSSLFIPRTQKVSLSRLNMAPLQSQVLDSLKQFNISSPKNQSGTFKLPDEL